MLIAFAGFSVEMLAPAQSQRVECWVNENEEADGIVGHRAGQCC